MPNKLVLFILWLICLYYTYDACTMPIMPIRPCLIFLYFACTVHVFILASVVRPFYRGLSFGFDALVLTRATNSSSKSRSFLPNSKN